MSAAYIVRRMENDDIDALFDFRRRVFPINDKQMNRERWSWLFQKNPFAGKELSLWIIETQDRIAGSIGVIPIPFIVDDKIYQACLGVDYFVEESFKGLPALQLLKKALNEYPIFIGSNISDSGRRLLSKIGGNDLSSGIYTATVGLNMSGDTAGKKLQTVKSRLRTLESFCLNVFGYQTSITDHLPDDYSELWRSIGGSRPCGIVKDASYLRWRYEHCPTHKHLFVVCRHNRRLCAMLVIAVNMVASMHETTGVILDLFVSKGSALALMAVLCGGLKYLQMQGCHTASLSWNALWAKTILRIMGFSLGHSDLGLLVWVTDRAGCLGIAQDPRNWTFTLGDTDRF